MQIPLGSIIKLNYPVPSLCKKANTSHPAHVSWGTLFQSAVRCEKRNVSNPNSVWKNINQTSCAIRWNRLGSGAVAGCQFMSNRSEAAWWHVGFMRRCLVSLLWKVLAFSVVIDQDSLFCQRSPLLLLEVPVDTLLRCFYRLSLVRHGHSLKWLSIQKTHTGVSDYVCIKTACGQLKDTGQPAWEIQTGESD